MTDAPITAVPPPTLGGRARQAADFAVMLAAYSALGLCALFGFCLTFS